MKTKHWIFIAAFVMLGVIVYWLWDLGILSGWIALISGVLSFFGIKNSAEKSYLEKKKKVVDQIIKDMSHKDKEIKQLRKQHDEEVKQVEESDYSDIDIDELIDSANERERKRGANTSD